MPVNEGNHPVLEGRCRSGYRPASCFTEAKTNGRKDTADIGGHGRDERTVSDIQMPGSLEVVDALMEQLDGGVISAAEALEQILSAQVSLRRERRIISAMRSSRLRGAKTLDSFDFSFQPSIDRAQIMNLHQLGFITRKEKSSSRGRPTWATPTWPYPWRSRLRSGGDGYTTAPSPLVEAERQGRLRDRLATLRQPSLLTVDEIGYLPVGANGANLFFQLVNARYEKASTVLTSNKSCQAFVDTRFGQS